VRIISGEWGGRRLAAPPGRDTRPTADRVREALFSILGPLDGERVLDLYAGSGALGLEALSRGAGSVTFVERAAPALRSLRANIEALGAQATVIADDVAHFLRGAREQGAEYDLVFLDPPYRAASALGRELTLRPVCAPGARVVAESDRRAPLELDLPLTDERRYGDTLIRIHALP
jgi:16S rRNA (guanine966-N2)-methyltransferase